MQAIAFGSHVSCRKKSISQLPNLLPVAKELLAVKAC